MFCWPQLMITFQRMGLTSEVLVDRVSQVRVGRSAPHDARHWLHITLSIVCQAAVALR
jgi:hypothetical protein|eukprot:SAG25_NODE_1731_length_2433_cov_1.567695_2_plen_58_part_00